MKDMHLPSLGYCYADFIEERGAVTHNCLEVAYHVRELARGLGVLLPEGNRFDPALESIVRRAWAFVEKRAAK